MDFLSGGGSQPYVSPNVGNSEAGSEAFYNRLGAKKKPAGAPGTGMTIQGGGGSTQGFPGSAGQWDFTGVGTPLQGKEGLATAKDPYDFSPINQAVQRYQSMGKYNPYQFNFGQLPDQYTKDAYQLGASDINKAGEDSITRTKEAIGTRRPGLLMRSVEDIGRDTNKNLSQLGTNLNLNRINQNLQLGKEQQGAQADENKAARNIDLSTAQGLLGAGTSRIDTESGVLGKERDYRDQALQYLLNLYQTQTGQANNAASQNASKQNNTMASLATLAAAFI